MHLKMTHMDKCATTACIFGLILSAAALIMVISSCGTVQRSSAETITTSGLITVRGNEPFTEYVLETDENTFYVLKFGANTTGGLSTPIRASVSGRLYGEMWDGRLFAHIDVEAWEVLD